MLLYFGESASDPSSSEAGTKPEDFFGLVAAFSSSLQKASMEMHVTQPPTPPTIVSPAVERNQDKPMAQLLEEEETSGPDFLHPGPDGRSTLRGAPGRVSVKTIGRLSVGRGDLDQAIRSLRDGQRRADRSARPLSKMFLDGGRQ